MKILGKIEGELDIKRCYFPGLKMWDVCPECSYEFHYDGDVEYIGYPDVGKPIDFRMYCRECHHEWSKKIQILVRVVEVQTTTK